MLNLAIILEDSARRYPDKMAFQFMDTALTFTQINAAANQVANGLLQQGIQPGDKVGLSCLNLPYFPIIEINFSRGGASNVNQKTAVCGQRWLSARRCDELNTAVLPVSEKKPWQAFCLNDQVGRFRGKRYPLSVI